MRGSIVADSYCQPCPRSTFEKAGTFIACEGNSVAAREGSTKRVSCDVGTAASAEKTECVIQPPSVAGNTAHQISSITTVCPLAEQNSLLFMPPHSTTFDGVPECTARGAHACAVSDSGAEDFDASVTVARDARNKSFAVTISTISGGAAYLLCSQSRKTVFSCAVAFIGLPEGCQKHRVRELRPLEHKNYGCRACVS